MVSCELDAGVSLASCLTLRVSNISSYLCCLCCLTALSATGAHLTYFLLSSTQSSCDAFPNLHLVSRIGFARFKVEGDVYRNWKPRMRKQLSAPLERFCRLLLARRRCFGRQSKITDAVGP